MKKILVIEDNKKHLKDAEDFLKAKGLDVIVVENYEEAFNRLDSNEQFDGVISDVFFPIRKGGIEVEGGTEIAYICLEKGIPVVLCTSTFHHGEKTQPVCDFCREMHISLIDVYIGYGKENDEAESKNWSDALSALLAWELLATEESIELEEVQAALGENRAVSEAFYNFRFRESM